MTEPVCRAKKGLFTSLELSLYSDLLEMAGSELRVLPKLSLWSLLEPDVNQWERNSGWDYLHQRIIAKQVDFVIFDLDWNLLCLINLIDCETGEQADPVINEAVYTAKFPLLNIFSYQRFSIEELAQKIAHEVQKIE